MKSQLSGKLHHGDGLLTSHRRSSEIKLIKRRKALPGFPKELKFSSEEEFHYFNNERLLCFLCGKTYRFLSLHIRIHGHNVQSYKEKYNIQSEQGLIGIETLKKCQQITHERSTTGDLVDLINVEREKSPYCKKGHLLNERRACNVCSKNRLREKRGYLPREIARKTFVNANCTICGSLTIRCKLSATRPILYCDTCKKEKYYEAQKKYNIDREKRNRLAKICRDKKKALKKY